MKIHPLALLACLAAIALLAPSPAEAGCRCAVAVHTTQPSTGTWGLGSDCTAAHNDLINNLDGLIDCGDEVECSVTFVQKTACFFDTMKGMWREDGVYNYRCIVCFGPFEPQTNPGQ